MDYQKIIDKYYPEDNELKRLLIRHSHDVAHRALLIADRNPQIALDRAFVEEAAMLHDIGIFTTDAPGIHCNGKDPYIRHGINGAELLRADGLPRHAKVCERHTGTGITRKAIEERALPLPPQDFTPETPEEILVCYADKFFSKSHPDRERTVEQTARSLEKFGTESVARFMEWARMFGEYGC
ncbi:HD domain-containing protein [Prevotella sp. MGM1]|uniref:HD domain-containing protein n=1 Tax=Prevotella sp. MGM1 TaxID=2033405 RepID=UPI000CEA3F76|nr:HD domain-containing protein [Prevotella sp. MGM1]GAY27545.1 phosphohydrolase [Prevotella sp. MGM1]